MRPIVVGLLALTLGACSGAASPSAGSSATGSSRDSPPSGALSGSVPAPSVAPREVIGVDMLLAEATAWDGKVVAADGDFLADQRSSARSLWCRLNCNVTVASA